MGLWHRGSTGEREREREREREKREREERERERENCFLHLIQKGSGYGQSWSLRPASSQNQAGSYMIDDNDDDDNDDDNDDDDDDDCFYIALFSAL